MKAKQAVAWIKKCGIAVESARASVPSLAHVVAGELTQGSWWAHPKGHDIFLLSRVICRSPHVLVCRLVDGKITYVHRRMWPALVSLAGRFSRQRLAALKEVHTPSGKHKLLVTPFPDWVPDEVQQAARKLTEKEAALQLALVLSPHRVEHEAAVSRRTHSFDRLSEAEPRCDASRALGVKLRRLIRT